MIIKNVNIFDGSNEELLKGVDIRVIKKLIEKIEANLTSIEGEEVIDGKGMFLSPGLIDCHVHIMLASGFAHMDTMEIDELAIRATKVASGMVDRGFTTVRDAGGYVWGLKNAIDEGIIKGPRIYPSGAAISQTAGHSDYRQNRAQRLRNQGGHNVSDSQVMRHGHLVVADGVPEVLKTAREQLFKGATQLKVMAGGGASSLWDPLDTIQYTREELRAIVETAKNYGTYVMGHLHVSPAMKIAIEEGVKSIEHGSEMSEEVAKMMVENNVWLCPQYATAKLLANRELPLDSEIMYQKTERVGKGLLQNAEWVKKYKIKTVVGTDVIGNLTAHESQSLEMPARQELFGGLEAMRQATSNGGELLKLSTILDAYPEGELGVIKEGAYADFILTATNPIEDAAVLGNKDNILVVWKDGEILKDIRN